MPHVRAYLLVGLFALTGSAMGASIVVNGGFDSGTLSGFTVFTTANGTNGAGLPNVVSFDTTGTGASNAAHFNVGEVSGFAPEGGGLSQTITIGSSGLYTISENFASQDPLVGNLNGDGGTFSLLLNGMIIATDSLGAIAAGQIDRGSLSDTAILSAGPYLLQTEITRSAGTINGLTPDEYLDNISVTQPNAVTPEPSSFLLGGTGVLAVVGAVRRRRV